MIGTFTAMPGNLDAALSGARAKIAQVLAMAQGSD